MKLSYKDLVSLHTLDRIYISTLKTENFELRQAIDNSIKSEDLDISDYHVGKIENLEHQIKVLNILNFLLIIIVTLLIFCL